VLPGISYQFYSFDAQHRLWTKTTQHRRLPNLAALDFANQMLVPLKGQATLVFSVAIPAALLIYLGLHLDLGVQKSLR
jgi:hypothetical protein